MFKWYLGCWMLLCSLVSLCCVFDVCVLSLAGVRLFVVVCVECFFGGGAGVFCLFCVFVACACVCPCAC